jgi:transposase
VHQRPDPARPRSQRRAVRALENLENLTDRQALKLARIQILGSRLYRAYVLCQQLRQIYRLSAEHALVLLQAGLNWARRSRLQPFVKAARRITEQHERVEAAITNKVSNAAVEQVNTQIRLITRRRFGYHLPWAVIALVMLSLAGLCRPLPGR